LDRALGEPHRDRIEPVWLDGPEQHIPTRRSLITTVIREWAKHASPECRGGPRDRAI
jgi:hypothetical protein